MDQSTSPVYQRLLQVARVLLGKESPSDVEVGGLIGVSGGRIGQIKINGGGLGRHQLAQQLHVRVGRIADEHTTKPAPVAGFFWVAALACYIFVAS